MLVEAESSVSVDLLTHERALEEIAGEWFGLWAECPSSTPFQSPRWLVPWWRRFGQGDLCSIALRSEKQLVAMIPIFLSDHQEGGREVQLIGTGVTDYLDALCRPGFEMACGEALVRMLEGRTDWQRCNFEELQEHSLLLNVPVPEAWEEERTGQSKCPVLEISGLRPTVDGVTPFGMMDWVAYYWRRAADLGPVRVEMARPENFNELFEAFVRLNKARAASVGRPALPDRQFAFYRDVASGFLGSGILRLYGWRIGDRIVASLLGFEHHRRFYYYLGGFDPEFGRLSPGNVLIAHAIEDALRRGIEEFDFLRGDERYKYRWGAQDRISFRRVLTPHPPRPLS